MSSLKSPSLQVVTRKGTLEPLDISIVRKRLESLSFGLNLEFVNLDIVVHKVEQGVHDKITSVELDNLAAETCAYMVRPRLVRTSSTLTTASLPPESQSTTSGSRPGPPSGKSHTCSTTARTSAAERPRCSIKRSTTSSSRTTRNWIRLSTSSATLASTSSGSRRWKGPTCSRSTETSSRGLSICSCGCP